MHIIKRWSKIFGSLDKNVLLSCQYYSGFLPLEYEIDIRKIVFFIKSILSSYDSDLTVGLLLSCFLIDYGTFEKYSALISDSKRVTYLKISGHFENSLKNVG